MADLTPPPSLPLVTFERVGTGQFRVLVDGEKNGMMIVNGSIGISGRGRNVYGIVTPTKTTWIGSLQTCKKMVAFSILKRAGR